MTTAVLEVSAAPVLLQRGTVYCPICTHSVPATVLPGRRGRSGVQPGQKCPRCSSRWTPPSCSAWNAPPDIHRAR